ncbi:MAG: glucuronate isomerase [Lachnospiraceae bacterium]|nr:glucuronate isomerase [Lachnospiraceae bacterium]
MRTFMDADFLLESETAKKLYHETAENLPIYDFHNHLSPKEIYEDKNYSDIVTAWLGGDHYKYRVMRANGVPEELVTGNGDPKKKFLAWADTVQNCFGNPLYHWTHLELQRYFDIHETLTPESAEGIYEKCNSLLQKPEFSVRNLLKRMNVKVLCTTDDPADDLCYHKKLAEEEKDFHVYPTFRPEKAMGIGKEGFNDYLAKLEEVSGVSCKTVSGILEALEKRLDYFVSVGCRVTDHSLEEAFYLPATEEEVDQILKARAEGKIPSEADGAKYRGYLLTHLGKLYAKRGLVMQLHIGAIRNNSSRLFKALGPDVGLDSENDFNYAPQLSGLLDSMDQTSELPKTILYYLNSKDTDMLASMAGNFQSNDQGIRGKVQLGAAWWFQDHKYGMEHQMNALANVGLLSTFVGMLTDSRSFLSFSRHEYFRRILCNLVGNAVERGEYPMDLPYLKEMIQGICAENARTYFNF